MRRSEQYHSPTPRPRLHAHFELVSGPSSTGSEGSGGQQHLFYRVRFTNKLASVPSASGASSLPEPSYRHTVKFIRLPSLVNDLALVANEVHSVSRLYLRGAFMAECTYCKTETELSYNGVPVCLKCEREHYPDKPLFIRRPSDKTPPSDQGTAT
jgi:hypothetical protein